MELCLPYENVLIAVKIGSIMENDKDGICWKSETKTTDFGLILAYLMNMSMSKSITFGEKYAIPHDWNKYMTLPSLLSRRTNMILFDSQSQQEEKICIDDPCFIMVMVLIITNVFNMADSLLFCGNKSVSVD